MAIDLKINKERDYIAYSLPVIASSWLIAPLGVLQGVYAKYFGLPLSDIALIIFIARCFDAISDPIVGYYCDSYYHLTGTRKIIILVGGLSFIVCSYFLYVPFGIDINWSGRQEGYESVDPYYFFVWFILFYLAWTVFEIPHMTWAGDLCSESKNITKIYGYRSVAQYCGPLFFFMIPLLPVFPTTDITPESLKVSVVVAAMVMLVGLLISMKYVPDSVLGRANRVSGLKKTRQAKLMTRDIITLYKNILGNKPFLIFITAFIITSFSVGLWYSVLFIYVDAYLLLGKDFAPMFVIAFAVGIFSTPLWCYLANRLTHKIALAISMLVMICGFFYTSRISPESASLHSLVALQVMVTSGFSCLTAIGPAVMAKISDYESWKSGTEKSASLFSLYAFSAKMSGAMATALGLAIAGSFGFDATSSEHTEQQVFGIKLVVTWLPLALGFLAVVVIVFFPITQRHQEIIRARNTTKYLLKDSFISDCKKLTKTVR